MPTYCEDADMLYWLGNPSDDQFPDEFDTAAERADFITQGSALADALVGEQFEPSLAFGGGSSYQRFPDEDADPPTPYFIRHATSMIAGVKLFQAVGSVAHLKMRTPLLLDEAYELLRQIREGEADVYDTATGATFGERLPTSSLDDDTEHEFTVGQYDDQGNLLSDVPGSLDRYTGGRFGGTGERV